MGATTPEQAEVILAHLAAHKSIRKFTAAPVEDEHVAAALACAQRASTSSNVQAYALLRVRDEAKRARLVELTGGQPYVAGAGAFFVLCGDQRRHHIVARAAGTDFEPNLESFLVAAIDTALFAQNLTLAFEAQGYGCCMIGGLRNDLSAVDELLELPDDVMPFFGLCVGVPDQEPIPRPRLEPEAILHEERFPRPEDVSAAVERYDERMGAWYQLRGKQGVNWSGPLARKFEAKRREHLKGYYEGKGARLE